MSLLVLCNKYEVEDTSQIDTVFFVLFVNSYSCIVAYNLTGYFIYDVQDILFMTCESPKLVS